MSAEKSSLSKTIVLHLLGNDFTVKFPNTGQMMDIDTLKLRMTSNKYDDFKFSVNPMFQRQALVADAIATFTYLVPELKKNLTVDSLFDLEFDQMDVVLAMFTEQYLPWYEEWMVLLTKPKATEPVNETTTSKSA